MNGDPNTQPAQTISKQVIIGVVKRNNGIRGPGYAEWDEPVYGTHPAQVDAGEAKKSCRCVGDTCIESLLEPGAYCLKRSGAFSQARTGLEELRAENATLKAERQRIKDILFPVSISYEPDISLALETRERLRNTEIERLRAQLEQVTRELSEARANLSYADEKILELQDFIRNRG